MSNLHREIFFAHNGFGPYKCIFCKKRVGFDEVLVHHFDHDHSNNDTVNLVPSHKACHLTFHSTNRSDETRKKLSKAAKGKPKSAEHRRKISESKLRFHENQRKSLKEA